MKNNKSEIERLKEEIRILQKKIDWEPNISFDRPKMVQDINLLKGELKGFQSGILKAKDDFIKIIESKDLLERLSDLEHQQWENWSKNIVNNEKISEDRLDKWAGLWKPYNKLTEEQKEKDREYARLVLEELKQKISKEIKDEKQ